MLLILLYRGNIVNIQYNTIQYKQYKQTIHYNTIQQSLINCCQQNVHAIVKIRKTRTDKKTEDEGEYYKAMQQMTKRNLKHCHLNAYNTQTKTHKMQHLTTETKCRHAQHLLLQIVKYMDEWLSTM